MHLYRVTYTTQAAKLLSSSRGGIRTRTSVLLVEYFPANRLYPTKDNPHLVARWTTHQTASTCYGAMYRKEVWTIMRSGIVPAHLGGLDQSELSIMPNRDNARLVNSPVMATLLQNYPGHGRRSTATARVRSPRAYDKDMPIIRFRM